MNVVNNAQCSVNTIIKRKVSILNSGIYRKYRHHQIQDARDNALVTHHARQAGSWALDIWL